MSEYGNDDIDWGWTVIEPGGSRYDFSLKWSGDLPQGLKERIVAVVTEQIDAECSR